MHVRAVSIAAGNSPASCTVTTLPAGGATGDAVEGTMALNVLRRLALHMFFNINRRFRKVQLETILIQASN
jgi:hypothetical protein